MKNIQQTIKGWTIRLIRLNRKEWEFTVKLKNKRTNNKEIILQKTVSKRYRRLRKQYEYAIKWLQTDYRGDENNG